MRLLLSIFLITLSLGLQAQTLDLENWKDLRFRNIGPAGMSGRITAIDVDLSNPEHIYVGAASGGVWFSSNGGTSWKPIFDDNPTLSIGSIKINQNNPDEIWVGTGEGNPRNSLNTGAGIYKTIDGGKTWKLMGLEKTKTIHRIIIHRDNPNVVYAASLGAPWGNNVERGVFRTEDGGATWKKILYVDDKTGAADMVVDPTNPNKLLVAMWEHGRKPWTFNSGGKGSGLYLSYDGGDNWKKITDKEGMPEGDLGRIGIAISPSKPNIIYALVEAEVNGLYKSVDGGEKWTLVSEKNIGNRPFYYSEIYVDPKNENRIFNLWSYVSKSEDGGKTFKTIMDYGNAVHPDHHAFWIHPEDTDYMINGNDGGLNISRDGGYNWTFVNNLPVGQFYHVNIDNDFPYNVYGGMQDNGSWIGPSSVLKRGGIRNYDFQELYFGDGFDVVPFRKDSRYGYAMSQQGYVGYYDRETGSVDFVRPVHPDTVDLRFNWNAAIAQDPFADCGVYFGTQFVHYSDDCGQSWKIISDDLTTDDKEKQKQGESGGLTIDATGAENYTTILVVAPSPVEQKTVWASTDDGQLHLTRDGGENWSNLSNRLPGMPAGAWIPYIEVSRTNAGEAFVIVNDYRRNNYSAYAYHTKDFGTSWTRIADDRTVGGFTLSLVQDPEEPNLIFLGTDVGLYVSFDYAKSWKKWDEGFPSVQVSDLKIQEREDDLVIGTFGRALWVLDDINPLRAIARDKMVTTKEFKIFDIPQAYDVSYRSYDGVRFNAQGEFVGDNDNMGVAAISLWVKPSDDKESKENTDSKSKKKKKKKSKKDKKSEMDKEDDKQMKTGSKVKFVVLNERGDTIRRFTRKVEKGFNRTAWYLDMDGVNYPSRRERKEDADPSSGYGVLPGTYKIVGTCGDFKDSSMVEVKVDPRRDVTAADLKAKQKAWDEYHQIVKASKEAYDLVRQAKKSVKLSAKLLENQEDTIQEEFKEVNKEITARLDSLEGLYFMEEGLKGIQRNPKVLQSVLYSVDSYIDSGKGKPGPNAQNAIRKASSRAKEVISAVNEFYTNEWPTYQEKINTLVPKIFKEYELIDID